MRNKRNKLLIYLIDKSHSYEYGIKHEFESDEVSVVVFKTFDDCSRVLHKNPSVIIMDDVQDPFKKGRIKSRIDQLPFKIKLIFIAPPGAHDEDIAPQVFHDDYVVKDSNLFEKLHIAVDEFAFSSRFKEDYDNDILIIDNKWGRLSDLLLPVSMIVVAVLLLVLSLVA